MAFHEVLFPTDISYESEGGAEFSTEVVELMSGHERRNQNWEHDRERWNVAYGVKAKWQLMLLRDFHRARRGMLHGFRFLNHDDFEAVVSKIGTGDGVETIFQLQKVYEPGTYEYSRKIVKPIGGTVQIFVDGVEQMSGWTVSTVTGIVTFTSPPSIGDVISATFDFHIPMRFASDHLPINLSTYEARSTAVELLEIRQ